MFTSRLFNKIFISSTLAIILLFTVMYLLYVPYIQKTVEQIEENSARTILNNVYDMVEQTHIELENYRQSITLERKHQLRNILSVADGRIRELLADVRSGRLSREQALSILLSELRRIKYGRNDYIWVSDYNSVLISHPDPRLNNADYSNVKDSKGNLIVPPMVEMALKGEGDGYYSYWWRRLGEEQPVEKITYFRHIPEFRIVIGTGVYLDDIEAIVSAKKNMAVEDLRMRLKQTHIAKSGYVFIFDGHYFLQIHPDSRLENRDAGRMLDTVTQKPILPMLAAVADKPESISYQWDKPTDPGNPVYEKISWVRYFSGFDWYICSSAYIDELGESARTLRNRVLATFIATLLLSVTLIYIFVIKLTRPLLEMRDTALKVIDGDLDARCSLKRDDEIGTVATALDNMVERLQENIQHLDMKVAERTEALENAYLELRETEQVKSDFLTTVSHELRTPMTTVSGFVKQIKKKLESGVFPKVEENEKTARAMLQVTDNLEIVIKEAERFTRIVNDLLYCATLQAGNVDWNFTLLQPEQLIKRSKAVFMPLAERKGLELYEEIEPDLSGIVGDEDRLFHVLCNLLDNAVKFTGTGCIVMRAEKQDGFVCFTVRDTGCGIAREHQEIIFDKFRQIGETLTAKPQGTGLGLAICQQIIQHHGGRIWTESELNAGSRFCFTVPVNKPGYIDIQSGI